VPAERPAIEVAEGLAIEVAERLAIEVVYCPRAGVCDRVELDLKAPATLADALRASGLPAHHGLAEGELRVGVWGRVQPQETLLRTRDRVEIYRPLIVDPKEARRLRYRQHREASRPGPPSPQGAAPGATPPERG
jgi:hypothetical protein